MESEKELFNKQDQETEGPFTAFMTLALKLLFSGLHYLTTY